MPSELCHVWTVVVELISHKFQLPLTLSIGLLLIGPNGSEMAASRRGPSGRTNNKSGMREVCEIYYGMSTLAGNKVSVSIIFFIFFSHFS